MTFGAHWLARGVGMLALATLVACGGARGADPTRNIPLEEFSPEQIFLRGELELERNNPDDAAAFFGEVERLYPFSEFAKRALIMQAFAYHEDRDYQASQASAQRYLEFYPADEDAAYAQYLLALGYYDRIDDVGRDSGLAFQAAQALRTTFEVYPDSPFARSARLKFDLAFDHLAAKEMEVGRYYLKRGHFTAAINRFRVVVQDFQGTTHTPEALYRLIEAYLSLGLDAEAQTAGAILGFNYQASEWYQDGFVLLTGQGLRPSAESRGWLRDVYAQVIRGEWL
ncbi:MAG: outer membrane protein assembly factor BamD [Pseudomonadota bacterium]